MFTNKEEAYYSIILAAVFALVLIVIIIVTAILYYNRKKRNLREQASLQSKFSQTLLESQLEIQEQTLKAISQEIHDNIGQALSLTKLNLSTMDPDKQEELKSKISLSKDLVSKAIMDLRDLSKSLNSDSITSMGLIKAIEYELNLIRKTGFETAFDVKGEAMRMESSRELIVFRILQESLNNIIKHADAKKIYVTAMFTRDQLEIEIKDDGKGADFSLLSQSNSAESGLGLRNMRSRAMVIGAGFTINSHPGQGTSIGLRVPFTNQKK